MKKIVSGLSIGLFTVVFAAVPVSHAQRALKPNTNAVSAATTDGSENQLGQVQVARQYIGQELKTQKGERVGKVEDFVVDLESGRILYAVVNSRAVPVTMLQPAADKKSLTVQATKQQLNGAPTVPKGTAAQLSSASFASNVYRHYKQPMWWQGDATDDKADKNFGNVHRVTQLSNMSVESSANEKVGKIQNVLLDVKSGHVAFLILNPTDLLGKDAKPVAVPPNAFTKGTENTLVTGIEKEKLASAPKYNNNPAELSQPAKAGAIYSYYGKQPWFESGLSPTGRE